MSTNEEQVTTVSEDASVSNETEIIWTDVERRNRNAPPKAVGPQTPQSTIKCDKEFSR